MPSNPADDQLRSGSQFSLGGVMAVLAVLALVFSIVSRAARSGSPQDWSMVVLSLGMFSILTIPILILGLVIRHSPSSRDDERAVIGLVVKTFLLIMLLCLSVFINRS